MFKGLFGKKQKTPEKTPSNDIAYEHLSEKSLSDIAHLISNAPPTLSVNSIQAISRRLIEIAYFDESIDPNDRAKAAQLEEVIWTQIEKALEGEPASLKARREARDAHIQGARQFGEFSLFSIIKKLPPEQVVPEIVKPENWRLLTNFPRDAIEAQRGSVLIELLRSRAQLQVEKEWTKDDDGAISNIKAANAVTTAGWLTVIRDPTALWLLTTGEKKVVGNFLDDYTAARTMLIALGAIQQQPEQSFSPEPDPASVHHMILQACTDGTSRIQASHAKRYRDQLAGLNDSARGSLTAVIFCLRIMIWKKTVNAIFGHGYFDRVTAAVQSSQWPQTTSGTVSQMESLYKHSLSEDANAQGFHNFLIAAFVLDILDDEAPEFKTDEFVQGCAEIFKSELFHFPPYVRFLLSFMIHGGAGTDRAYAEDALV